MAKNDEMKTLRCSFCGKTQDQVSRMIAGPGVCICNECVELCESILMDEGAAPRQKNRAAKEETEITIPKPREIKEILDEYVIGQDMAKIALSVAVTGRLRKRRRSASPNPGRSKKSWTSMSLGRTWPK